jgi:hypothetical protein
MNRLILLVRGCGEEHGCQPIARRQFTLAPVAIGRDIVVEALERRVVGVIGEGPGQLAQGGSFQAEIGGAPP